MELPAFLQSGTLKPLAQGAAMGAIATVAIGFGMYGWVLGGTAAKQVEDGVQKAVAAVLAPICASKFQNDENATANMASFKSEAAYLRTGFIEKGGWAVLPGNDKAGIGVASACATLLSNLK